MVRGFGSIWMHLLMQFSTTMPEIETSFFSIYLLWRNKCIHIFAFYASNSVATNLNNIVPHTAVQCGFGKCMEIPRNGIKMLVVSFCLVCPSMGTINTKNSHLEFSRATIVHQSPPFDVCIFVRKVFKRKHKIKWNSSELRIRRQAAMA